MREFVRCYVLVRGYLDHARRKVRPTCAVDAMIQRGAARRLLAAA